MNNGIKLALLDFDGTLVTKDILDLLCAAMGKEEESRLLNEAFHRGELKGLGALIARINFLSGMTKSQIAETLLPDNYLMPGAMELMEFFKKNGVMTMLASGNIVPVLEYYQKLLGITYIVGPQPKMDGDKIVGIDQSAFSSQTFKVDAIQKILQENNLTKENCIAIGDSPSDRGMFELSSFAIAINPKGNIAEFSDAVIRDDLREAVKILEEKM